MARRPVWISIAAVLSFVATLLYTALAVLWFVYRPGLVAFLHALSPGGSGPEKIHLAMGQWEPVYYAIMAVVMALVGRGLWRLQNWTRILILVMVGISLLGLAVTGAGVLSGANVEAIGLWLLRLGLCVACVWYLMSQKVRAAFGRGGSQHANADLTNTASVTR